MKILYTITKGEIGGAQVHVAQLAEHMKDAGHAVAILSAPGGWLENEATKMGVRFYPNPYFANSFNPVSLLKAKSVIKKVVSEWKPDIVHCHSSFAGVLTRLTVRGKIPTIFTAHSWAFTDGASLFRKIIAPIAERVVSRYTTKIICVSEYDRKLAIRYKIAPKEKLTVVYNGVVGRRSQDIKKEETLISVGRLSHQKNYSLLLKAFKKTNINGISLEIVGDGPDKDTLRREVDSLGLKDKVRLLGEIEPFKVMEKILRASIFVLISRYEGFPLSILEAMSAGLPVIASRVGGIPEEIDSTCGILVSNDIQSISKAIVSLSDNNIREEMGRNARKRFEEKFTLEKFLRATENVYKDISL